MLTNSDVKGCLICASFPGMTLDEGDDEVEDSSKTISVLFDPLEVLEDEEELEPRFEANRPFVFADDEELPLLEDVLATEVPCSISFFFSSSSTNLFMRIIKFRFAH